MAVTELGSVVILYSVATAVSFSTGSLRMAHDVMRFKTGPLASSGLLAGSADMFCSERSANKRFSAITELDAVMRVSMSPSKRASIELLAGNLVKFKRISRHLV
jgi:hypothetical protein